MPTTRPVILGWVLHNSTVRYHPAEFHSSASILALRRVRSFAKCKWLQRRDTEEVYKMYMKQKQHAVPDLFITRRQSKCRVVEVHNGDLAAFHTLCGGAMCKHAGADDCHPE